MKSLKHLPLLILLLFSVSALAQQSKNAAGVTVGANYSDMNYGTEFLSDYMPRMDYLFYSTSGEGFYAYNFGLNYTRVISNKFSANLSLLYTVLNYKIDGEVANRDPSVTRPPSPTIPISVDGVVKYSFFDIQLDINYSFNQSPNQGLFLTATANSMFHLNTNWYLNVINEDLSESTDKNITGIAQPDYNTLWFLGLGAGYHFNLSEDLTLTPLLGMKYGLNPLVDGTISPTLITLDVTVSRWF